MKKSAHSMISNRQTNRHKHKQTNRKEDKRTTHNKPKIFKKCFMKKSAHGHKTHVHEVVGLNPAVYCMDVSDLLAITLKKNLN